VRVDYVRPVLLQLCMMSDLVPFLLDNNNGLDNVLLSMMMGLALTPFLMMGIAFTH
jgi:hypothetical protein